MNIKSARRAAEFVRCCSFDSKGRLSVAVVPGHNAKLYQVSFNRIDNRICVAECVDPGEGELCKGHRHSICFHAIAALIHAAEQKQMRLAFCATKERAERISRAGGTVVEIVAGRKGWIVYRKKG